MTSPALNVAALNVAALNGATSNVATSNVAGVHLIGSDEEAVEVASNLGRSLAAGAAERDRERRLPWAELEALSSERAARHHRALSFWRPRGQCCDPGRCGALVVGR